MGWSLSWTAVRGKPPEAVLEAHGLRPTGAAWDLPDRRHPFAWAALDGGWVLVVSSPSGALDAEAARTGKGLFKLRAWHDPRFMDESEASDPFLASLSAGCEVVCCFLEEHVMVSRAAGWKDGDRLWSVLHDGQEDDVGDLQVVGAPPPELATIEAAARAEQRATPEGVDFVFDVPVDLAKALTGFRHDELEREYELLEPVPERDATPGRRPSLLARLFGRGARR